MTHPDAPTRKRALDSGIDSQANEVNAIKLSQHWFSAVSEGNVDFSPAAVVPERLGDSA